MARILDEASVRIGADTRQGERDAKRAGENYGREFTRGADGRLRDARGRFIKAGQESGEAFGEGFTGGAEDKFKQDPVKVRVDPLQADFERRLRATVRQIASRVNANIPLTVRGERFRQDVARNLLDVERTLRAKIPVDPVLAADFRRTLTRRVEAESRRVRARVSVGVDVDRNRVTSALSGLVGLIGRAGEKVSSVASTAFAPVNKILGSFNLSLSGVIIALTAVTALAPVVAAGISIIGGAAIGAFGALTAGAAGLPVLLTSLIAPIAAIALGMDGIKRAAEPLKDEFKTLKDLINITFELNMRPVFEKLQAIFPTLNAGLSETARAVSRVAMDFAGILTTPAGIENLRVSLAGVSDTIDRMRPGLRALFTAFLNIAGTRELYDILGDTIGGVSERFAGMLERMRSSGDLTRGLEQVRDVLFSVTDALAGMSENALKFAVRAGPGLTAFIDSLTRVFARVDWGSLGESFGRIMERLGAAIERVPPETWRKLADAVGKLAEKFITWAESGGMERLIETMATAANVLSGLSTVFKTVYEVVSGAIARLLSLGDVFSGLGGKAKSAADGIGSAFSGVGDSVASGLSDLPAAFEESLTTVRETVDTGLAGIPEQVGGWFDQARTRVVEAWQGMTEDTSFSLDGLGQRIDEFFATLPDRIGYVMGYMAVAVPLKAQEAVEGAAGWFSQLPERVGFFAVDMTLRLQSLFQDMSVQVKLLALQAVMGIVTTFQELPGRVATHAALMVERLRRFFSDLPGMLKNLAVQAVSSVVDAFKELPRRVAIEAALMIERVLRFFRELPGKLYRAGVDAIQGFIDGVKAKAQSVVDAAKDVVSGAIRGARDALVSSSPSRVFRDLGKDTVQGYILGLRERIAPMVAQIKAMFAQASAAVRAALEGAVRGAVEPTVDVVLGSVTDAVWDRLLAMGYRGDPTDRREALVNVPLSALQAAQGVTTGAAGSGLPGVDVAALAAAVAEAWGGVRLAFVGPSVVEVVNDGNRRLARR